MALYWVQWTIVQRYGGPQRMTRSIRHLDDKERSKARSKALFCNRPLKEKFRACVRARVCQTHLRTHASVQAIVDYSAGSYSDLTRTRPGQMVPDLFLP